MEYQFVLATYLIFINLAPVYCGSIGINSSDVNLISDDLAVTVTRTIEITNASIAHDLNDSFVATVSLGEDPYEFDDHSCLVQLDLAASAKFHRFHFPCTCFKVPGVYIIRLYTPHHSLKIQTNLTVWKKIRVVHPLTLHLPTTYDLSSGLSVPLQLQPQRSSCHTDSAGRTTQNASMISVGPSSPVKTFSSGEMNGTRLVIRKVLNDVTLTRSIDEWNLTESPNFTYFLSCGLFTRPGDYQVAVIIDDRQVAMVIDSNGTVLELGHAEMSVTERSGYEVRVVGHFVYPCPADTGLPVTYRRSNASKCSAVSYEAIRLYTTKSIKAQPSIISRDQERIDGYVAEMILPYEETNGVVYFGCNLFDLIYPKHCFQLVTVYKNGEVVERDRMCVLTQKTKYSPIHGQWSSWQTWGPCTVSCGPSGVQHRIRYCDAPSPENGGEYCKGNGMETRECMVPGCPNVTSPRPRPDPIPAYPCACGCRLNRTKGGVVAIYRHVQCPVNPTVWTISSQSATRSVQIRIMLKTVFDNPDSERILIWETDNPGETKTLLFDSSVVNEDHRYFDLLTRTGHVVIKYISDNHTSIDKSLGALIGYRFVALIDRREKSWWARFRSDRRLSIVFTFLIALMGLLVPGLLYYVSWQYTVKKLHSKRSYLMRRRVDGPDDQSVNNWREMIVVTPPSDHGKTSSDHLLESKGKKGWKGLDVMQASTRTEETRLSVLTQSGSPEQTGNWSVKSVRSIGIQLSSPPIVRSRTSNERSTNGRKWTGPSTSAIIDRPESPNLSIIGTEVDDFEYDYYDAPVPGSVFNYQGDVWRRTDMETDVFIEDIIERSELMKPIVPSSVTTVSVSTQSQPVLEGEGSAGSSEWSFKWTKPNTANTQFHFL